MHLSKMGNNINSKAGGGRNNRTLWFMLVSHKIYMVYYLNVFYFKLKSYTIIPGTVVKAKVKSKMNS